MLVKITVQRISKVINFGSSFVSRNSIKFLDGTKFAQAHQGKLKMMMSELYPMQIWLYLIYNSYEKKETDADLDLGLLGRFHFFLQSVDGENRRWTFRSKLGGLRLPFQFFPHPKAPRISHFHVSDLLLPTIHNPSKQSTCLGLPAF